MPSCQAWSYSHQSGTVLTNADRWHIKQQNTSGTGTKFHVCGQLPPVSKDGWVRKDRSLSMWGQDTGCPHGETWRCCVPGRGVWTQVCWCVSCSLLLLSVAFMGLLDLGHVTTLHCHPQFIPVCESLWSCFSLPVIVFTATESFDCLVLIFQNSLWVRWELSLPNHVSQLLIINMHVWRSYSTIKMLVLQAKDQSSVTRNHTKKLWMAV